MSDHGYIKSLDGVRAFAIVLVMSLHSGVTKIGWIGVQLFFVLSGYLITGILWKEKSREAPVTGKLKKFWVRRSLRIFPLYFGYLFVLTVVYLLFHFPESFRAYIPYLLSYTYNFTRSFPSWQMNPAFAHLWSLAIEEQFYLFFPLILFLSNRRLIKVLMIAVIFVSPGIRYLLGQYFIGRGYAGEQLATIVYWNTLSHLDAFFLGGLIPVFSLHKLIKRPYWLFLGMLLLALVCGAVNYVTMGQHNFYPTDLGYGFGHTENYVYVWHYTVLNLFFASLILLLVSEHRPVIPGRGRKLLESKWLVRVGKVSYGMYIYHWLIWFYLFQDKLRPQSVVFRASLFIPYLVVVYVVAAISFKFYEAPFIKLKDRYFPSGGTKSKSEDSLPAGAAN
jgi:peptidoglycan/LPS O-acetylase OafA/YrhL